jgi:sulfate transport system ATP-binding protein
LAIEPKVLLLDEPFGALDSKVRKGLRNWLRRLHEQVPVTTVFVTHDQQEAMEVASEIVVLDRGNVQQMGSPQEIYQNFYSQRKRIAT